ncbi:MAG: sulfatase family protein [Planctomycetota bacterium]|jgi:arylsulfatase A-like enzyme
MESDVNRLGIVLSITILLLSLGCGSSDSEEGGAAGPRPNIVLFTVDTLRADRLGCYGNDQWNISPSPTMDRLASRGILFEKCYAPRGQTHPSIASMLTGKYPITHTLRENGFVVPIKHRTIIQMLNANGYTTAAFVANMSAHANPYKPNPKHTAWWTRGCDAFGDGFGGDFKAATDTPIEDQWTWDQRIEDQALEWIRDYDPAAGKPFFLWAHFYDPHKPYLPHSSSPDLYPEYDGQLKSSDGYEGSIEPKLVEDEHGAVKDLVSALIDDATRSGRPLSEKDHSKVLALYDASQYGVDERYDRILSALHEQGLLESTWIFFTSDHGEEMGDHQYYYYHGASIYNAVLHIPLIVVGPDAPAGLRVEDMVQNLDLAPTIVTLAGLQPLPGMEGISMTDLLQGRTDRIARDFVVAEWQEYIYAWFEGKYKYIMNPQGACPVKPPFMKVGGSFDYEQEELYDLEADPKEQHNLLAGTEEEAGKQEYRSIASEMQKKLIKWIRLDQHQRSMKTSKTGEGSEEAIKALGYTGVGKGRHNVKFKK